MTVYEIKRERRIRGLQKLSDGKLVSRLTAAQQKKQRRDDNERREKDRVDGLIFGPLLKSDHRHIAGKEANCPGTQDEADANGGGSSLPSKRAERPKVRDRHANSEWQARADEIAKELKNKHPHRWPTRGEVAETLAGELEKQASTVERKIRKTWDNKANSA